MNRGAGVLRRIHRRGASLIGVLLAATLILAAVVFLYGRKPSTPPTRPDGPTTTLGQGLEQGKDVACANNLRQIRYAIGMKALDNQERPARPASLQELRSEGIGPSMLQCPVTGQAYGYDPASGRVWCVTPGHERF